MNTKKLKSTCQRLMKSPNVYRVTGILLFLILANTGYCASPGQEIESQVTTLMGTIFSKPIRLIIMLFGITWGFLKTVLGGSFQPLIMYGGLGCCFFFIPKIIMLLSSIGG